MDIKSDVDKVFKNAIKRGMKNPDDWMYMYSDKGRDFFKHYDTRNYKSYPEYGSYERPKKNYYRER